jgi:hypothetical protein
MGDVMELISMTCRTFGGKLKIMKDADQFICQHCGTEYLVSFTEGAISIKLLSEGLQKIQVSSDKTASELALARIKKEKDEISGNIDLVETLCDEFMERNYIEPDYDSGPISGLEILRQALRSEKSKIFKNRLILKN